MTAFLQGFFGGTDGSQGVLPPTKRCLLHSTPFSIPWGTMGVKLVDTDVSGRSPKYLLYFALGFESWAPPERFIMESRAEFLHL